MKQLLVGLAILTAACGSTDTSNGDTPLADDQNAKQNEAPISSASNDVAITMEGATLNIPDVDWERSRIETVDGELRYELTGRDSPLTVNLNVSSGAIPIEFPATFTVPDDNIPKIKIDLNFFNSDRPGKSMQKRIIFTTGTIDVRALGPDTLDISFRGSGHPLMANDENFAIKGHVRATR